MTKLLIEEVIAHKVQNNQGGVYLRACPVLPSTGPTPIWYAATMGGWELIPDALYNQLEADFQAETKGTLQ